MVLRAAAAPAGSVLLHQLHAQPSLCIDEPAADAIHLADH
jgi:hypothetical protein